jgi:hypothetical protein
MAIVSLLEELVEAGEFLRIGNSGKVWGIQARGFREERELAAVQLVG